MKRFLIVFLLIITRIILANVSRFENFTITDGLPDSYVETIFQDSKGYLWLGTGYGVCKYDGNKFENIKSEYIFKNSDYKTHDGNKIILGGSYYSSGFYEYNGKILITLVNNFSFIYDMENEEIEKDTLIFGKILKSDKIFISSEKKIEVLEENGLKTIVEKDSTLSKIDFISVLKDINGNYWFSTYEGDIYKYNGFSFTRITEVDSLLDKFRDYTSSKELRNYQNILKNRTLSLLDSAGDLWFATRYGILKYNGENFEFYNKTNDKYKLNFKEIGSIIEVKNGDIIFTSNGANNEFSFMYYRNDVIEYNQKSDEFIYKKELSEKIGGIKILFKDSKKNLIFCSWNKGIFLVNKNIINFNKNDGLTSLFFTTFYEDCEGNYWFGTYDGLSKIKNAFVNVIKNKEETIINSQLSLSSKNVLLGTNEGLFEFAGNKLNKINKIGSQNISQLYQDSKDNIWIITLKELFLYNRKTYQKIENPLKQYITLFEDKNRDIWIFDDKNFAKQNKKGFSIQNNNFDSIVGNIDIWFSVGK